MITSGVSSPEIDEVVGICVSSVCCFSSSPVTVGAKCLISDVSHMERRMHVYYLVSHESVQFFRSAAKALVLFVVKEI